MNDKDPTWNPESWQQQNHFSVFWRKYDHGFAWLQGKDECPACGERLTLKDSLFYFENMRVNLVDLKCGLANMERLLQVLKVRTKLEKEEQTK